MNQRVLNRLHTELKNYFLNRKKGSAHYNLFYTNDRNIDNIMYPLIINRNFFSYDENDRETKYKRRWVNDVELYDKYVLEHITPFLKKFDIETVTFTFSCLNGKFNHVSQEREYKI